MRPSPFDTLVPVLTVLPCRVGWRVQKMSPHILWLLASNATTAPTFSGVLVPDPLYRREAVVTLHGSCVAGDFFRPIRQIGKRPFMPLITGRSAYGRMAT